MIKVKIESPGVSVTLESDDDFWDVLGPIKSCIKRVAKSSAAMYANDAPPPSGPSCCKAGEVTIDCD